MVPHYNSISCLASEKNPRDSKPSLKKKKQNDSQSKNTASIHLKDSTTNSSNKPHSGQPQSSSKNINDPWKQALSDFKALSANASNDDSAEIPAPNHTEGKPCTLSTVNM